MYILKVVTTEVGTKEKPMLKRFLELEHFQLQKKNGCITQMELINEETGEIINEYKRL